MGGGKDSCSACSWGERESGRGEFSLSIHYHLMLKNAIEALRRNQLKISMQFAVNCHDGNGFLAAPPPAAAAGTFVGVGADLRLLANLATSSQSNILRTAAYRASSALDIGCSSCAAAHWGICAGGGCATGLCCRGCCCGGGGGGCPCALRRCCRNCCAAASNCWCAACNRCADGCA